jgi:hypothetical protein
VGRGVELVSIRANAGGGAADVEEMRSGRNHRTRLAACVVSVLAAGAILAGCGTPAVIKPSATPLPGLQNDIHAAQSAVARAQAQAQSDASTSVSSP